METIEKPVAEPIITAETKPKTKQRKPKERRQLKYSLSDNAPHRPKTVNINWEQFENIMGLVLTLEEVAGYFKCDMATIHTEVKKKYGVSFSEIKARLTVNTKMNLRRAQLHAAIKDKNIPMMIWLGKNMLGQTDKIEETLNIAETFTDLIKKARAGNGIGNTITIDVDDDKAAGEQEHPRIESPLDHGR